MLPGAAAAAAAVAAAPAPFPPISSFVATVAAAAADAAKRRRESAAGIAYNQYAKVVCHSPAASHVVHARQPCVLCQVRPVNKRLREK